MLPKAYEAKDYEDKIYKNWEESGAFKADVNSDKEPFTISMPPPNATGVLHLGHAVMLAIEDILIRHRRMKGYEALWLPGTDHAAIATESVVIKNLKEQEGIENPRSLGREKLIEAIAEYVAKSQNTIRSQVRKMGASCDWSRERYTMDQSLNRCVNEVFKKMYDDGLIYRGERVVNWDVALQTTLADDEVEHKESEGILYTFEYISAKQTGGEPVYVATSRPETKLGDNALAVHPNDDRYKHLIGKTFEVNWPGGHTVKVTVIADHTIDKEFGTGAVGVTPFHSKIDYELWQRHKDKIEADPIQVINEDGEITNNIKGYEDLNVNECREKFVEGLRKEGRLKSEEKYVQQLSISYRSKKPIEPLPKLQWFIDVNKKVIDWKGQKMSLKEIMQNVVKEHDINIIPDRFEKTYFHWINNLQDWCISRQIWWGHRIPVWYKDDDIHVDIKAPDSDWKQDPDTLDTWFSSALWTWSTLIDPEKAKDYSLSFKDLLKNSPDFNKFHPTQVMETGYDILFFWIARMILMTTYAIGKVPFDTVYLHGLIRTREGKKMSKSDPETCIDPLDMIAKYGADALRMSMVVGNTPGNDMRLYEEKIAGYRNFINKLWNIARYILSTVKNPQYVADRPSFDDTNLTDADKWILQEMDMYIMKTSNGLDKYVLSITLEQLRNFTWDDFADWYIEISKAEGGKDKILMYILQNLLKLWHPFAPFVTEAIWSFIKDTPQKFLIKADWPENKWSEKNNIYRGQFSIIRSIIKRIRNVKNNHKIEPAKMINIVINSNEIDIIKRNEPVIKKLARATNIEYNSKQPKGSISIISDRYQVYIKTEDLIDTEKEKERLQKEIGNLESYIKGLSAKLSNDKFVKNAPADIVDIEKKKLEEAEDKIGKMKEQLEQL